jgi:serine/threonine protein kinase/tetratricopeptide (TPR) repeat protein
MKCPKCNFENPDTQRFCGDCGTQFPPAEEISAPLTETLETPKEELTTGSTFAGRYQIIEELGKGGMGKVYKAQDTDLKEKVAIKLLRPEIAADKKTIERFRNELKFARKIRHKNVCQMYDLNKEKGAHYITMEYVAGKDLKGMIRMMGQLSSGKTIFIAKQVCEGLVEAHRLGVVHRDLKPQNIMVDEDGNARIMDFGIARSLKTKGITAAGVMIGTPEYMSPEQVEGKEVDQRSDIYSLGVILYEMVTGRVPFEGDTPFTIGVKHKSEMPKDPKELNTQLPEDLNLVILRCLEKDKEKRYQSAGEVRAELTRIEKGIPTTEIEIPKRKPITSKEITVTFGLKKLFIPAVVVIALIIAAIAIWQLLLQKQPVFLPPEKPSIAVLPFDDLSPQKDQGYLCDGFAESLINALTKVKGLRVPARTSSFSFKGKERDVYEIGKKLNVKTILEGSIQKAENRIRITAQLINVSDESLVWSDQYNRELEDVFAIQDEITLKIVDMLKVNLLGGERAKLVKRHTENLEAYNLYLKGRHFWNKRTSEGLTKALDYFEKALEIDQNYALAYTGVADCHSVLPWYGRLLPKEEYPKARTAALNALKIDNLLAEAHTSLAAVKHWHDWDWSYAEREYKRAIELNPGYATAHQWYGSFLGDVGRADEAIAELKRAVELDPLSLIINTNLADYLYVARRYDDAIEQYKKTLDIYPEFGSAQIWLGRVYLKKGMFEEALKIFKKTDYPLLTSAYTALGKRDEALKVLEKWKVRSAKEYVDPVYLAMVYLGFEERDQVFKYLEKAYQERHMRLFDFHKDPFIRDIMQPDPRYKNLLKKMGLER